MLKFWIGCIVAILLAAASAQAEDGYRHHGAVIAITPDGKLDLLAAKNPLKVVGGSLSKADGKWSFTADPAVPMDVVDFVVDAASLKGKQVRLRGGEVTTASADVALYGSNAASIVFKPLHMPKEDARFVLKTCTGFSVPEACKFDVIGTADFFENGSAALHNVSIVRVE